MPLTAEERKGLQRLVSEAREEQVRRRAVRERYQAMRWAEAEDPEISAKKSAGLRRHWAAHPERRAEQAARSRAMWADPEHRERHRAAMREAWKRRKAAEA